MRVVDLIRSRQDVYSIGEETTVHDEARYLRDHQVRSVAALDAGGTDSNPCEGLHQPV